MICSDFNHKHVLTYYNMAAYTMSWELYHDEKLELFS